MSVMKTGKSQSGEINVLLIPLILVFLLLIGTASFAYWAFAGRLDYKNNSDQKVAAAVSVAKTQTQSADAKSYAEAAKKPLQTYVGPEAYGSVHISYPKTWSAYVDTSTSSTPLNGYFYPAVVPGINDLTSTFALRVQIVASPYDQMLTQFSGQVQSKQVTVTPYKLPKVPNVVGSRVDGQIEPNKQGSMIILPIRDKTLEIWSESNQFLPDFNNSVLPNSSFSP